MIRYAELMGNQRDRWPDPIAKQVFVAVMQQEACHRILAFVDQRSCA